jgi:hypothetical protein
VIKNFYYSFPYRIERDRICWAERGGTADIEWVVGGIYLYVYIIKMSALNHKKNAGRVI